MAIIVHGLLTSLAAGTGLVFNGYILVVLLWHRRIQTANNLLLLHLAFVDTVFCFVVIAGNASWGIFSGETNGHNGNGNNNDNNNNTPAVDAASPGETVAERTYSMPRGSCEIQGFAWTAFPVIVMWTVCGLSCDRYAAISTPLHYSRIINIRKASIFLAVVWILSFTLALPPLFDVCYYGYYTASLSCIANCTRASNVDVGYAFIYVSLAVGLPLMIVLICNLHILTIARYHRHRIVSAIYQVTLSAQATVTHQRNPFYLSKFKGKNAILTIFQLVGSLLALAAPYFGIVVWEASTGSNADPLYVSITSVLFTWTPPVNAYVYGVKSRVLRQTFKTLLQRHLNKREAIRLVESRASLNPATHKRTLCRRSSAPAGYFGWENALNTFSRSSPFTGSLKRDRDVSYARTRAFHRRPSFMVDVGSSVGSQSGVFEELHVPGTSARSSANEELNGCESPKSGLWMDSTVSTPERKLAVPEIVITAPCLEALSQLNELLVRKISIPQSRSEPNSPDINHGLHSEAKVGRENISGSPGVSPRCSPRITPDVLAINGRILQRRKTIYSILPVRNQLPDIKEVTDDVETLSPDVKCGGNVVPTSNPP